MMLWAIAALLAGASATTPAGEVAALRDFYAATLCGGNNVPACVEGHNLVLDDMVAKLLEVWRHGRPYLQVSFSVHKV